MSLIFLYPFVAFTLFIEMYDLGIVFCFFKVTYNKICNLCNNLPLERFELRN